MEKEKMNFGINDVENTGNGVRVFFNSGESLFIADILMYEILEKYGVRTLDNHFHTSSSFADLIIKNEFKVMREVQK